MTDEALKDANTYFEEICELFESNPELNQVPMTILLRFVSLYKIDHPTHGLRTDSVKAVYLDIYSGDVDLCKRGALLRFAAEKIDYSKYKFVDFFLDCGAMLRIIQK